MFSPCNLTKMYLDLLIIMKAEIPLTFLKAVSTQQYFCYVD